MGNQKRRLPPSLNQEQPQRKRGRPAGKNRVALSEAERKERNATYERERRGIEAALTTDLAQAAGLDTNLPKMVILDEAAKYMSRGWENREADDIREISRINANLISQIHNAKARLRNEFGDDIDIQKLLDSDSESSDSEEESSNWGSDAEEEGDSNYRPDLKGEDSSPGLKEEPLTSDSDLEEEIGAMRMRPYSGEKTAPRVLTATVLLSASNKDIKTETVEEEGTPDSNLKEEVGAMRTRPYTGRKTVSRTRAASVLFKKNTEEKTVTTEVAPSQSEHPTPMPPELLLPDIADLDAYLFENNAGSDPAFSSLFSEDASMSTRPNTARYTPAKQG